MNKIALTVCLLLLSCCAFAQDRTIEILEEGPIQIAFHPKDRPIAEQSLTILQEAILEYAPRLDVGEEPVRVFIAYTLKEFSDHARSYSQVTVSGIAKPWKGLIVVKSPRLRKLGDDYRGTLRHELVHVLLFRNIETAYMPKWLNEGLAMSLANEHRWMSSWQMTKMFFGGRIIPYRHLENAFLAPGSEMQFGDAYAQALSMTRYLRNKLGEERFWAVILAMKELEYPAAMRQYGGLAPGDFWDAYNRSLWLLAFIGMMASGSLFTPGAFLLIAAWWRTQCKNKRTLKRWEEEEAEEARQGTRPVSWDEAVEDPEAWKGDYYEEEESW